MSAPAAQRIGRCHGPTGGYSDGSGCLPHRIGQFTALSVICHLARRFVQSFPRRSNEVIRIAKKINVDTYMSFARTKALIRSYPFDGTALWYIYDQKFAILEKKQSLSAEELQYPIGSGMKASEVFELVDARWSPEVLVPISESGQYPKQAAGNPFKLTY